MEVGVVTPASQHLGKIPLVFTLHSARPNFWPRCKGPGDRTDPEKAKPPLRKEQAIPATSNKYRVKEFLGNWEK